MMFLKFPLWFWKVLRVLLVCVVILIISLDIWGTGEEFVGVSSSSTTTSFLSVPFVYERKKEVGWEGIELKSDFLAVTEQYNGQYNLHRRGSAIESFGENYIYYLSYCGTGCHVFNVVNVSNGKNRRGMLVYSAYDNDSAEWFAEFFDWKDAEYRFDGELKKITLALDDGEMIFSFFTTESEYDIRYPSSDFE